MLMLALNKAQAEKVKHMKLALKKSSSRQKHSHESDPTYRPHSAVCKPVRHQLKFPSSNLKHTSASRFDNAPLTLHDIVPWQCLLQSQLFHHRQCLRGLGGYCGSFRASFTVFLPRWIGLSKV